MAIFRWLCCLCLVVLAGCGSQVDPSGFGGTWILTVNQQILMILTLQRDGDTYRGSLAAPQTVQHGWSGVFGIECGRRHGNDLQGIVERQDLALRHSQSRRRV